MGFIDKMVTAIQGKANSIAEGLENTSETLDLAYEQGSDGLRTIHQNQASILSARKLLEKQKYENSQKVAVLDGQAKTFSDAGQDDKALAALKQKAVITQQIKNIVEQIKQIKEQEATLAAAEVEQKQALEVFVTEKEALKARLEASKIQADVSAAMSGIGKPVDIGSVIARANAKIDKANARSSAISDLKADGTLTNGIGTASSIDNAAADLDAQAELATLKAKKGN